MTDTQKFQQVHHQIFVDQFVQLCQADDRVVAACLVGSTVKGTADQFSDLDLSVITTDDSFDDFHNRRASFLGSLGDLVFLEDFQNPSTAFYIFADGTEGELTFGREGNLDQILHGPFQVLVDKKNILAGATFSEPEPDPDRQLEKLRMSIYVFWHELSHFTTAMGRGQLWWARGQLEALRSVCVNLARLRNNFLDEEVGEEPYFKIEKAMAVEDLGSLKTTFCPIEETAMLESTRVIVKFYKEIAPSLAQEHGITYPAGLERVMVQRLEKLLS